MTVESGGQRAKLKDLVGAVLIEVLLSWRKPECRGTLCSFGIVRHSRI